MALECLKLTSNNTDNGSELSLKFIEVLDDICIHVVDKNGRTIYYSKGCEKIEQYKKEDILGKTISETYMLNEKSELDDESSLALKVLKTGKAIKGEPMKYITKKGQIVSVISSAYPLFSNDELVGAICVFKDVSQIMEMSNAITKLQDELFSSKRKQIKNGTEFHFRDIIGSSKIMQDTIDISKRLAVSQCSVLIVGETGSGKELFAQSIHNYSPIAHEPFVAINCSAIPETLLESILFGTTKGAFTGASDKPGIFEEAGDGTLFLDEINSMSMQLQAKILRVLETKKVRRVGGSREVPVKARIISATNINPVEAIKKNQLREDLYYRLAVLTVEVPPLRMRTDDIEELVMDFINKNNKVMGRNIKGITDEAMGLLKKYRWPGNVRQLKHTIDYATNVVDTDEIIIMPNHLPPYITDNFKAKEFQYQFKNVRGKNLKDTLLEVERNIIIEEIKGNDGNLSQTAKNLGISRQNLQYRLKVLGISK